MSPAPASTPARDAARDPLPERLRQRTAPLHRQAERSGAMAALLRGALPQAGYLAMLRQWLCIYEALETAMSPSWRARWLAGLDAAALFRTPALRADLGPRATASPPVAATGAYADRLWQLGQCRDAALLGHVYTRYLGDLYGGLVLRRLVQRRYPGQTTHFYEFGGEDQVERLRAQLRQALATAPLDETQEERVLAEACWAFEQHIILFEALCPEAGSTPGGAGLGGAD
jgi:heme oxygenase (biliverdin-producing, ferredoxin)